MIQIAKYLVLVCHLPFDLLMVEFCSALVFAAKKSFFST